jgi:sulfhydrogenase subunit beta (sulfur reductase)
MKILKLQKKDLSPFLEVISREAQLWAPVAKGDKFVFDEVKDFSRIATNAVRTVIPPKKIMVPSSFSMFHFSEKGYQEDLSHITDRILFGIHPCDIHGLLTLDKLFVQAYPDPYYLEARKRTLILGLSCWPDEFCLCKSTHTDIIEEGYDLFFTDLENCFLVWIGSSRGDDLIRLSPDFFDEKLTDKDIQTYIKWQEDRDNAFRTEINFTRLPDLMELKTKAPFWEEAGAACLACGSCSMVCPTCNCYNVVDKQFLGKRPGQRIRYWDSCTLPEYSEVAGGENFREQKSQRLRLWYTHKLQAYVSKYGKPSCVGCGRCLVTCPVGIHVKSVADALEGQAVDVFWKKFAGEVSK